MRSLPPVEIIPPPERWSQTILDKHDKCPRSAYLYQKYHGGQVGHQLDRGSIFHLFAARATELLIEHNQPTLGEIKGDIDWTAREGRFRPAPQRVEVLPGGRRRPSAPVKAATDMVKTLLEECYDHHPELTVPLAERDAVRQMAYHWAAYPVLTPANVVAVERKFVYQLPNGHWISGIIDVAELDGNLLRIRDYKTQWDVPSWDQYANTFQGRFYAVLAMFGNPVTELFCSECAGTGASDPCGPHYYSMIPGGMRCEWCGHVMGAPEPPPQPCKACGGRGYFEELDLPIAGHVLYADVGEVYPRRLIESEGGMAVRSLPLTRLDVEEIRDDLVQQTSSLAEKFATGLFPAVDGAPWCDRCPAESECPLPSALRAHAGTINTMAEAREAASWMSRTGDRVKATKSELRAFARHHGPIRFGSNHVLEFRVKEGWAPVKWDETEAALAESAKYGTPFELSKHRRPKTSMNFEVRRLTPAEIEAEKEQTA